MNSCQSGKAWFRSERLALPKVEMGTQALVAGLLSARHPQKRRKTIQCRPRSPSRAGPASAQRGRGHSAHRSVGGGATYRWWGYSALHRKNLVQDGKPICAAPDDHFRSVHTAEWSSGGKADGVDVGRQWFGDRVEPATTAVGGRRWRGTQDQALREPDHHAMKPPIRTVRPSEEWQSSGRPAGS